MESVQKSEPARQPEPDSVQALAVLQMPLTELYRYLSDQALENPLLEVEAPEIIRVEYPRVSTPKAVSWETEDSGFLSERPNTWSDRDRVHEQAERGENLYASLHRQLSEDGRIPRELLPLCHFLVDSLNARGYLEEPVSLLAEIYGAPVADMTQALYVLQEMSPVGVGARSLQECLMLQLVQTKDFNAHTVKLIREGLELLAENRLAHVAAFLELSETEAADCCAAVRRLNPIPGRGFDTGEQDGFVIPEAEVLRENGSYTVRYNDSAVPRVSLNGEYQAMLKTADNAQLADYLETHLEKANRLLQALKERKTFILRILEYLVRRRQELFEPGAGSPVPFPPGEAAAALELDRRVLIRAIHGKYLLTPAGLVEFRCLFGTPAGDAAADSAVEERLDALIAGEKRS